NMVTRYSKTRFLLAFAGFLGVLVSGFLSKPAWTCMTAPNALGAKDCCQQHTVLPCCQTTCCQPAAPQPKQQPIDQQDRTNLSTGKMQFANSRILLAAIHYRTNAYEAIENVPATSEHSLIAQHIRLQI